MGLLDFFSSIDEETKRQQDEESQRLLGQQVQPPTGQSMLQAQLPGQGGIDQAASPTALMTLQQLQQPPSLGSVMGRDNPYAAMLPEPKAPSKLDSILSGFSAAMKAAGGILALREGAREGITPSETIEAVGAIAGGVRDFTTEAYLRTQAHQQQVNERIKSLLDMANQERAIRTQAIETQANVGISALQQSALSQPGADYLSALLGLPQNSLRADILPQGLTEDLLKINPPAGLKEIAKRTGRPVEELMQGAYLVSPAKQEFNLAMMGYFAQLAEHTDEASMRAGLAKLGEAEGMDPVTVAAIAPILMGAAGSRLREITAGFGPPSDREKRMSTIREGLEYSKGLMDQYKLNFQDALAATFQDKPEFMLAWMEYEASFGQEPGQIRQQVWDLGEQAGIWEQGSGGMGGLGGMPGMPGAGGSLGPTITPEAAAAFIEKTRGKDPIEIAQMKADYLYNILDKYIPRAAAANAEMTRASFDAFTRGMGAELKRGKSAKRLMDMVDARLTESGLEFNEDNLDLMLKSILREFPELAAAVQNPEFYKEQPQAPGEPPSLSEAGPSVFDRQSEVARPAPFRPLAKRKRGTRGPEDASIQSLYQETPPSAAALAVKARILRADSTIAESIAKLRAEAKRQKPAELKATPSMSDREVRVLAERALEELVAAVKSGAVKGDSLLSEWYAKQPAPGRMHELPMQFPQGR